MSILSYREAREASLYASDNINFLLIQCYIKIKGNPKCSNSPAIEFEVTEAIPNKEHNTASSFLVK